MNPKKHDKKNTKAGEQGALGDLMSRSAESTPIADSKEVLNPAVRGVGRGAARGGTEHIEVQAASRAAGAEPGSVRDRARAVPAASVEVPPIRPVAASSRAIEPLATLSVSASYHPIESGGAARWDGPAFAAQPRKIPGPMTPRAFLAIALFMSVLIHITIGVVLAKAHIGAVDVSLLDKNDRPFLVKLPAKDDPIYSDPVLTAAGFGLATEASGPPGSASKPALGMGEVSKMLLLNRTGPATPAVSASPGATGNGNTDGPPGTGAAGAVAHPDVQPANARPALIDDAPKVDLPADVVSKLAGGAAVELPGVGAAGTTLPGAAPASGDDGPSTTTQAKSLLKTMIPVGPTGSGINFNPGATIPAPASPAVADSAPTVDRRLLESPSTAPPIEVTAITLAEARTLDIPEKLDDDFEYLVTKLRPEIGGGLFSQPKPDRYTYFRVDITAKRSLRKLKTMPKDVVFLIDTSGSVPQEWVNAMTRGVSDALGTLNDGDRFNIVFFSEKPVLFSDEKIQPADARTIAQAQQFLKGGTSGGDTDINRSLNRLLVRDTAAQRAYYLVFISDGVPTRGVMDTRELINLVTRDNDLNASIYCIGVGPQQNRELLNFLAYRNKGSTIFAKEPEQAAAAVRDLMSRVRYPIIKDVSMNVIGLDYSEVFPHNLPNIHQGETFSVFGRYDVAGVFTMRVNGHNGAKTMDVTFGGDLLAAKVGGKSIPEDWAFWKLHHIYSEIIRQGEKPELKRAIAELKERFDLKTLY